MITSIAFADIKSITLKDKELVVTTKKEGSFRSGEEINFGMNAIFGTFDAILSDEVEKLTKKPN